MKAAIKFFLLTIFILSSVDAQEKFSDPIFGDRIDLGLIEYDPIYEASGIAASRKNPNVLWTHNDSGDPNRIFAFNTRGEHLGIYFIDGAGARDWEDMAVGPGPDSGKQYLYIGEIGDNNSQHELKYIYRVPEPDVDSNQTPVDTTIFGTEVITYIYPDGRRDAEAIMVDPLTKDIYIVSKREDSVRVYCAAYPQSVTDTLTLEYVATLNLTQVTGGDISPSGFEILIKTYINIYYWYREPGHELWEAFANPPLLVPYIPEPQGEAVGWEPVQVGGYYTTSEELGGIPAHLYFYPRLDSTVFVAYDIELPMVYSLFQNYPNPFNPTTLIKYQIPELSFVTLKVYDVLGSEIITLINKEKPVGNYEVEFSAKGGATDLPSGIYFYLLQAGNFVETKKMVLIK
jgi:hypothetical protein